MPNPLYRARVSARHIIMMISAKGGVGKSTLTVNLAAALTARGLRVGVFDGDVHGPNLPALLGVRQKKRLDMSRNPDTMLAVEARPDAMDMRPMPALERYGLKMMSLGLFIGEGQSIQPPPAELGAMTALLMSRVAWDADVLLVDMPPGTGEPLNTMLNWNIVDGAIVVTTRERLAHLDNGRLLGLFKRRGVPVLGVVENMTHVICPNCGELIELYPAPAADQPEYRNLPVLGAMPFHPAVIRQNRAAAPLPLADDLTPADIPVRDALLALADRVQERLNIARPGLIEDDDCEDC